MDQSQRKILISFRSRRIVADGTAVLLTTGTLFAKQSLLFYDLPRIHKYEQHFRIKTVDAFGPHLDFGKVGFLVPIILL